MYRQLLGYSSCAVLTLVLISCASKPKELGFIEYPVDYEYLSNSNNSWIMEGKLSYKDDKRSAIVYITWQHEKQDKWTIRISSPQGEIALLNRDGDENKIRVRGRKLGDAKSFNKEFMENFGFYLPIDELTYWVRGKLYPGDTIIPDYFGEEQNFSIIQRDWRINYEDFGDGVAKRMSLVRSPIEINLAVSSWYKNF